MCGSDTTPGDVEFFATQDRRDVGCGIAPLFFSHRRCCMPVCHGHSIPPGVDI